MFYPFALRGFFKNKTMIKRKSLPCTECNDNTPKPVAFSRGVQGPNPTILCDYHNKLRKGKERLPIGSRKPAKKPTGELALFQAIWATRRRVSFLSGKPLGEFNVCYFAHVISKKQWPKGRLTDKNIILLTPEEHNLYDQGTEEQRAKYGYDWSKIYQLKEQLKKLQHEGNETD